jgi:hypothetical protein
MTDKIQDPESLLTALKDAVTEWIHGNDPDAVEARKEVGYDFNIGDLALYDVGSGNLHDCLVKQEKSAQFYVFC